MIAPLGGPSPGPGAPSWDHCAAGVPRSIIISVIIIISLIISSSTSISITIILSFVHDYLGLSEPATSGPGSLCSDRST